MIHFSNSKSFEFNTVVDDMIKVLKEANDSLKKHVNVLPFLTTEQHLVLIPHLAKGLSSSDWIYDLSAQAGLRSNHM